MQMVSGQKLQNKSIQPPPMIAYQSLRTGEDRFEQLFGIRIFGILNLGFHRM
jgi:hypothetical protein